MAFSLKNAPTTFQGLMSHEVLASYIDIFCIVYIDDLFVCSRNHQDHLLYQALVLKRLSMYGLTCPLKNVALAKPECVTSLQSMWALSTKGATPRVRRRVQLATRIQIWLSCYHGSPARSTQGEQTFPLDLSRARRFSAMKEAVNERLILARPQSALRFTLKMYPNVMRAVLLQT